MQGNEIHVTQNTPEWHELRRTRVTASEAYSALHYPNRAVREQVLKRLGRSTFKGNEATEYGHQAEPVAIAAFEREFGVEVNAIGFVTDHHEPLTLGCSPDGLFENSDFEERLLQVKCPYSRPIPEKVPQEYLEQVNFEMGVTGVHQAVLWYWTPDAQRAFHLTLDKDLWHQQVKAAREVWAETNRIVEGPDPEAFLAACEAESAYREDDAWVVASTRYRAAKEAAEAAQAVLDDARRDLLAMSGGKNADGAGTRVVWLERKGTVAWPKLVKEFQIPTEAVERYRDPPTRYAKVELV